MTQPSNTPQPKPIVVMAFVLTALIVMCGSGVAIAAIIRG